MKPDKSIFRLSEISALLTLILFIHAMVSDASTFLKVITALSFAVCAVMQHKAYYQIFKKSSS